MSAYVGIDIGGTKIAAGLVGSAGDIRSETRLPVIRGERFEAALDRLASSLRRLADRAGDPVCGIGIGCTGPVNRRTGTIENPHTLPGWEGRNIVAPLRTIFG